MVRSDPHSLGHLTMSDTATPCVPQVKHIVSQTDVVRFLHAHVDALGPSADATLEDLGLLKLAHPPVTVDPHVPTLLALDTMLGAKISGAPVVTSGGELVASISLSDLRGLGAQHWGALALPVAEFLARESWSWPSPLLLLLPLMRGWRETPALPGAGLPGPCLPPGCGTTVALALLLSLQSSTPRRIWDSPPTSSLATRTLRARARRAGPSAVTSSCSPATRTPRCGSCSPRWGWSPPPFPPQHMEPRLTLRNCPF